MTVRVAAQLVESGADVDRVVPGDENPLIQASWNGNLGVVRYPSTRAPTSTSRCWPTATSGARPCVKPAAKATATSSSGCSRPTPSIERTTRRVSTFAIDSSGELPLSSRHPWERSSNLKPMKRPRPSAIAR